MTFYYEAFNERGCEMKPIVSIIVPIHKFGDYFYKCLDFLIMQTLSNIEIIIIDDFSEDNVQALISQYLKDVRVKYIRLDYHAGPGGARNKGIEIASGKYIAFCDSDDWFDLNYCKKAYEMLDKTNADIAMCGQIREYDNPSKTAVYKCYYNTFYELSGTMAFQLMTYNYKAEIQVIPPCNNKIYRRDFLETNHFRFQESVYFQDTIFSVETILNCKKIVCVPDVLYHHYRRAGSIIQSFDQKHIEDFKNLGTSIKQYLIKNDLYYTYMKNYYNLITHFYGVIIREIFQFIADDTLRKENMIQTFSVLNEIIDKEEYISFLTAEQLRRHLIPNMEDTTLY